MERCGGTLVAEALGKAGVKQLYTLCGGHISPILVACQAGGIRVADVRDEASAVFAADAAARLSGLPGVAAVTAGPGITNAVTAVKNAQMAQSPVLVIGGATATMLAGKGSLQDINQMAVMRPITKRAWKVRSVSALVPVLEAALYTATTGVPGPVFVEIPVDVLYPESIVREWYAKETRPPGKPKMTDKMVAAYIEWHLFRLFRAPSPRAGVARIAAAARRRERGPDLAPVRRALERAERPVLVIGSQTMMLSDDEGVAAAVRTLGIPTFLGGMARGLLGKSDPLQFRHHRKEALREADLVLVAGFPFDFRLGYGRHVGKRAHVISVNLCAEELKLNRKPDRALRTHPGMFLRRLAGVTEETRGERWKAWKKVLRAREKSRDAAIDELAQEDTGGINPLHLLQKLDGILPDDSTLVMDGGDFVASASYVLRPRRPLSWLDPGVFGTLGVGGGFAVGAALVRPEAELWILYGDGSCAYSLAELDTCVRLGLAPIALVGNDGAWTQIAREQVPVLGDAVGTTLLRTEYHRVAEGYGAVGLLLDDPARIDEVFAKARQIARSGKPVLINAHIRPSDFRKGSISI
jgi:acetolactate synthase-1/2/3 large subunit